MTDNATRGSWQERQLYDQDPNALRQNDRRSREEFYMPLIFYLFAWLVSSSSSKVLADAEALHRIFS